MKIYFCFCFGNTNYLIFLRELSDYVWTLRMKMNEWGWSRMFVFVCIDTEILIRREIFLIFIHNILDFYFRFKYLENHRKTWWKKHSTYQKFIKSMIQPSQILWLFIYKIRLLFINQKSKFNDFPFKLILIFMDFLLLGSFLCHWFSLNWFFLAELWLSIIVI